MVEIPHSTKTMNSTLRNAMTQLAFAVDKLQPKASLYTPKKTCNYVTYKDETGWSHTYDPTEKEDYCESCIKKVITDLAENDTTELPDGFVEFESEIEQTKDSIDFCLCDKCSEIIDCPRTWSQQYLLQWIGLSEDDFRQALASNKNCYELSKLLDSIHGSYQQFGYDTLKIAERVFNAK